MMTWRNGRTEGYLYQRRINLFGQAHRRDGAAKAGADDDEIEGFWGGPHSLDTEKGQDKVQTSFPVGMNCKEFCSLKYTSGEHPPCVITNRLDDGIPGKMEKTYLTH